MLLSWGLSADQSTGLVSEMHQACFNISLQTPAAEFCEDAGKLFFWSLLHEGHICAVFSVFHTLTWPPPLLLKAIYYITVQTEETTEWKHFASYSLSCFVGIIYLNLSVLGCCLEEPTAADCWDEVWGVRVCVKLWRLHHLAFPNNGCEQVIALSS